MLFVFFKSSKDSCDSDFVAANLLFCGFSLVVDEDVVLGMVPIALIFVLSGVVLPNAMAIFEGVPAFNVCCNNKKEEIRSDQEDPTGRVHFQHLHI